MAPPDPAIAGLEAIANPARPPYFWTGQLEPSTAAKLWRRRLGSVAVQASVEGFHPHRLRDTFAVELLLPGVLMQDVSSLLGHSSVATTERHYAPRSLACAERLGHIVNKVHRRDPLLQEIEQKKPRRPCQQPPGRLA